VAAAGVAAGAGLLAIGWNGQSRLVRPAADGAGTGPPAAALPPLPPPDEFARHWPRFRGPDGGAAAVEREAPLRWDATTGAGLAWKAEVPLPGFNSPIVWDGRVFVSGATKTSRAVFCYDAVTGSLLWNCALPAPAGPGVKPPDLAEDTGYAAPTLATDGRHVYAIFAHGDLTALTLAGRVAWTRMLGVPRNPYGHAASLAVWEGNVIVQFDQGDTEAPRSRLLAFDGATGRPRWETARPVGSSWATPVVADVAGRAQIVTLGEPWVIGYAAADGSELWRARVLDGEIAPSPIVAGGLILAVSPWQALIAIKPDGTGDVTATHVAWRTEAGVPDTSSPVSDGTRAYVVNNGGELICFNLKDGAQAWVQELGQGAHASPAIFGRRLYVICTDGTTVVAESGPAYRELARNPLGEDVQASPALAGGRLYVRGVRHLFCLGAAAGPVAATP
jgi:outer membrane protein assembly factor BamB